MLIPRNGNVWFLSAMPSAQQEAGPKCSLMPSIHPPVLFFFLIVTPPHLLHTHWMIWIREKKKKHCPFGQGNYFAGLPLVPKDNKTLKQSRTQAIQQKASAWQPCFANELAGELWFITSCLTAWPATKFETNRKSSGGDRNQYSCFRRKLLLALVFKYLICGICQLGKYRNQPSLLWKKVKKIKMQQLPSFTPSSHLF